MQDTASDATALPVEANDARPLPPLTRRQAAFVEEFTIDLNATQAAIRAGYAEKNAHVQACDLLNKPQVAQAVAEAKAQRASRVGMVADTVLSEMSLLSHSCLEHYVIDDQGQVKLAEGAPAGAMRAIQSIKRRVEVHPARKDDPESGYKVYNVELKLWDKPAPLKLMGRHVGLFPDRVEHTGANGGPIEVAEIRRVIVPSTGSTGPHERT